MKRGLSRRNISIFNEIKVKFREYQRKIAFCGVPLLFQRKNLHALHSSREVEQIVRLNVDISKLSTK